MTRWKRPLRAMECPTLTIQRGFLGKVLRKNFCNFPSPSSINSPAFSSSSPGEATNCSTVRGRCITVTPLRLPPFVISLDKAFSAIRRFCAREYVFAKLKTAMLALSASNFSNSSAYTANVERVLTARDIPLKITTEPSDRSGLPFPLNYYDCAIGRHGEVRLSRS